MNNLEYLYANDRRALIDFVVCNSHCDDCRSRPYCDEFTACGDITEPEWLMMERDIMASTENGTQTTESDAIGADKRHDGLDAGGEDGREGRLEASARP